MVIRDILGLLGVFVVRVTRRNRKALLKAPLWIVGAMALRVPYLDTTNFAKSFFLLNHVPERC